ncbi:MAG TPA: hypothetical protein VM261_00255 [Kofleriaceae bacterium]|nr:hypothetical protein [Kofleriaceae bacterium]
MSSRIDLHVPVFAQREAECGNTSLKSVMWHLGWRLSARALGRMAGLDDEGINHVGLVDAARRAGASVYVREGGSAAASIAELRWFLAHGHPAIVGWWSMNDGDAHFDPRWSLAERRERDCGHFSVVSGIDATRVLLMDPQALPAGRRGGHRGIVGRVWTPLRDFQRVWYDTDTAAYTKVDRWYMVAHRTDERFASRFGAGTDHSPR